MNVIQKKMGVFQTYKAKVLEQSWVNDLDVLQERQEELQYKFCLPWKGVFKLACAAEISLMFIFTVITLVSGGSDVLLIPATMIVAAFMALQPLAFIMFPVVIYNFLRLRYNKKGKRLEWKVIEDKETTITTNLQTLQNGLQSQSVVPVQYQIEQALQHMMKDLKDGVAQNDHHAVQLYDYWVRVGQQEEALKTERLRYQQQFQHHQKQVNKRSFVDNLVRNFVLYSMFKSLFGKKN